MIARLLGEAYKAEAECDVAGALAIFSLAPQDYHCFHSPVEGRIGAMTYISGEYYTVNVRFHSIGSNRENILICYDYPAAGHPLVARRIRRERAKDRTNRQPTIRAGDGGLCRCDDGGDDQNDGRGG